MPATRIYAVQDKLNPKGPARLVKTTYKHRAIAHVAQERFADTHVASQDELVRLVSAGVRVELPSDALADVPDAVAAAVAA